jgi:hypothetical protein
MCEVIPGKYRHYKNKDYKVLFCATHTETNEEVVIYQALYEDLRIWARPKKMFMEKVEVEGQLIKRFKLISEDVK